MSDIEMGLIVLAATLGVILAPTNYLWAQVTVSYGLQHNRLRLAYWVGLAFGPLGPLVMRRLPEGDPDQFRHDLAEAYSTLKPTSFPWTNGIITTVLGAGFGYYILASLLIIHRLPYLPLWAIGTMLVNLGIGWLCHKDGYPPPAEIPAPVAIPSGDPSVAPRVVFDPKLGLITQANLLVRNGAWLLCFLLVINLFFMMITSMSTPPEGMRPYFPLTVVIASVLVGLIVAGLIWARRIRLQIERPEYAIRQAICPVCQQRIKHRQDWVIHPRSLCALHPRCQGLDAALSNSSSAENISRLVADDIVTVTEPGQACRVCGQFIDPGQDSYKACGSCNRYYHRACFGPATECSYCANGETVPAIAERISRENESKHRVPQGAYELADEERMARQAALDSLNRSAPSGKHVCRSCCTAIEVGESRVLCGRCRRLFHTACMAGNGLCRDCTAGRELDERIERYCASVEAWEKGKRRYEKPVVCPECGAISDLYKWIIDSCPWCGTDMAWMDASEPVPLVAEELKWQECVGEDECCTSIRGLREPQDVEVRHGWLQQKNIGFVMYFLAFIVMIIGFVIANYLPQPADDLLRGCMLGLLAVSVITTIVQWAVIQVRPWIWPMSAPSPAKLKLINLRTALFWATGLAGVAVFAFDYPMDAGLINIANILKWITLCLGGGASLLAITSLFVK